MATASPTPVGQGSHFTSLGRRTSARQALRRPPSRSQMGSGAAASTSTGSKRNSTASTSSGHHAETSSAAASQHLPYPALHDSSDDEMPIPMKLSALTKALLNDGASADDAGRPASAAEVAAPAMTTRRRSHLTRSTSSLGDHQPQQPQAPASSDRPGVRQTRRAVRAGSAAPSSASRPMSPALEQLQQQQQQHQDSSPAPRKRVVRLSATTPAGMPGQPPPPLRRSLSTSKHSSRRAAATAAAAANSNSSSNSSSQEDKISSSQLAAELAGSSSDVAAPPAPAPVSSHPLPSTSTPAGSVRRVQIAVGSSGSRSTRARLSAASAAALMAQRAAEAGGNEQPGQHETLLDEAPATAGRSQVGSASRYGSGSSAVPPRSVSREGDVPAMPSSMRVKRVGKVLGGGFLSGPARRGRRQTSDEDGDGNNSPEDGLESQEAHGHHHHRSALGGDEAASAAGSAARGGQSSFYEPYSRDYPAATGSPVSAKNTSSGRVSSLRSHAQRDEPEPVAAAAPPAPAPPAMPSKNDQENEMPYIRVPKPLAIPSVDPNKVHHRMAPPPLLSTSKPSLAALQAAAPPPPSSAMRSPERKVLASISRNTPHRPAPPPPPPKMSVLETATAATAGHAATTQANKKPRILLKVNGRPYQRVDCVGRGGSAKVYKVTAENGKMFAMKRVSLENADETTIRGFLGEIDLLKKLSGVDRVIQLYDYEMNKEKQMLSLLMELGEMDLNSLLRVRQNPESARLDPVFVRFYWKEMLESLQAVHDHDIVHSDLKPANFVLVQGRLKLIDFGIANAIQTDETVNVHRETQIGTPNYMSPESLMDAQQYAFTSGGGSTNLPRGTGAPKLMKLGKPSDVWSLGCILYQMVYGLPPFGHIQNQMARCQAIITWSHAIDFPARGLGGTAVPASLLATMRRCLNREQQLRPTCADLLSSTDPFLYPEASALADGLPVSEELLARIIQSVVARCRERLPTEAETLSAWPAAYWASVKRAVAARDER